MRQVQRRGGCRAVTGCTSLLRPIAATSAVLALGWAPPAYAASSLPATVGPDPSPSGASPAPDPYPGAVRPRFTQPVVTRAPAPAQPITPAPVYRPASVVPPKPRAVHRHRAPVVRHRAVAVQTQPVHRARRPEPPAPRLGARVFGTAVRDATRVPAAAALAVALLVLLSGLFLARTARELAR
jgi:hypothetical protein